MFDQPFVICFGEILWDQLPEGEKPGGAPMNVALHLQNMGIPVSLISRIGKDERGRNIKDYVTDHGLNTTHVQWDGQFPTGTAKANTENPLEVTYDIAQPAAWDYIEWKEEWTGLFPTNMTLVFGSLAARSLSSRETLFRLLKKAELRIFDINLRQPHYTKDIIETLLVQADWVKVNEEELRMLAQWFLGDYSGKDAVFALKETYSLQSVSVTLGADGAWLLYEDKWLEMPGISVKVEDTIGSGDGFLAALIKQLLYGTSPKESLAYACAMGASIATKAGATPKISEEEIRLLLKKASI